MEVHKPRFVANWRELFKEWGIIVLGVLTALLAEQGVQSIEWQNKVQTAVADMTNELAGGNGPEAYARVLIHDCVASRLDTVRTAIESGDREATQQIISTLWLPNRTYDVLARESATASDVAPHMPPQKALEFRIAYELAPEMTRTSDDESTNIGRLRALPRTGGLLEASEKLAANQAVEVLKVDNDTMARGAHFTLRHIRALGIGLDRSMVERNLREPRQHYPDCFPANAI